MKPLFFQSKNMNPYTYGLFYDRRYIFINLCLIIGAKTILHFEKYLLQCYHPEGKELQHLHIYYWSILLCIQSHRSNPSIRIQNVYLFWNHLCNDVRLSIQIRLRHSESHLQRRLLLCPFRSSGFLARVVWCWLVLHYTQFRSPTQYFLVFIRFFCCKIHQACTCALV